MHRLLLAGVGDVEILGDLTEPGFDGTISAKMFDFLQGLEKCFLRDLFRNMRILAHREDEQIHIPEKSLVQIFKINFHSRHLL